MSLTDTVIKAGVAYALGRLTANLTADDFRKVANLRVDDLKRLGLDRADAALGHMGLQRSATVPSSTALVLGGFLAGAFVGAGIVFLSHTEHGKKVRRNIVDFIKKGEPVEESSDEASAEKGDDDSGGSDD